MSTSVARLYRQLDAEIVKAKGRRTRRMHKLVDRILAIEAYEQGRQSKSVPALPSQ